MGFERTSTNRDHIEGSLRSLRYALTALGLMASVAMVAWSARSYFFIDQLAIRTSASRSIWISAEQGHLLVHDSPFFTHRAWHFWQTPLKARDRAVLTAAYSEWKFRLGDVCGESYVQMPLWCPALVFATVAGTPWMGKLSWRFSLRTLLIAMTLIAVALGLIVATSR